MNLVSDDCVAVLCEEVMTIVVFSMTVYDGSTFDRLWEKIRAK